jgi:hypothetical protein
MTKATDHAIDCDWHQDQYPHECNCGAVTGSYGTITLDRQLFDAMFSTLLRTQITFDQYALMHLAKTTSDGKDKAKRNTIHSDDCIRVLDAVRTNLA